MSTFSAKEREKFVKLLTLAKESSFEGERENALRAAENMARAHGMSLMEAANMGDADEARLKRRAAAEGMAEDPFGFAANRAAERAHAHQQANSQGKKRGPDDDWQATDKTRWQEAMEEARRRGLDQEEEEARARTQARSWRRASGGAWRSRPEFVRVLLRETAMSLRDVAATAGVSLHDVVKEKLLMRRRKT